MKIMLLSFLVIIFALPLNHLCLAQDENNDVDVLIYTDKINELLRQQLTEKDKQIGKLQEQLSETQKESGEAKERSDTLLLNLQRQLEQSQMMLESSQAKQRRSWWSRLWKRTPDETN